MILALIKLDRNDINGAEKDAMALLAAALCTATTASPSASSSMPVSSLNNLLLSSSSPSYEEALAHFICGRVQVLHLNFPNAWLSFQRAITMLDALHSLSKAEDCDWRIAPLLADVLSAQGHVALAAGKYAHAHHLFSRALLALKPRCV